MRDHISPSAALLVSLILALVIAISAGLITSGSCKQLPKHNPITSHEYKPGSSKSPYTIKQCDYMMIKAAKAVGGSQEMHAWASLARACYTSHMIERSEFR